jgi:hypothetical protein
MIRVPLTKSYIKRTIRPKYAFTQGTPKSQFLDPAWDYSVQIYPGMAMMKTVGENVSLVDATGHPYGLCANYIGGDGIDEITEQGVNSMAVWVLGPDAEFEILAPAFDETLSWAEPVNGTVTLVHAYASTTKRGKLCPAGTANATTRPVGRLIKVNSATMITVGGLVGTV